MAGFCRGDILFPGRYELKFYIQEDGILHSERRENFISYKLYYFNYSYTNTWFQAKWKGDNGEFILLYWNPG
jgi:hypothetical protein